MDRLWVASNWPLKVAGLAGNCARVPINGITQSSPMPVRQNKTASVERAETEDEKFVFISRRIDGSPAASPFRPAQSAGELTLESFSRARTVVCKTTVFVNEFYSTRRLS